MEKPATVRLSYCDADGWHEMTIHTAKSVVDACYALKPHECRLKFWYGPKLDVPKYTALVWEEI